MASAPGVAWYSDQSSRTRVMKARASRTPLWRKATQVSRVEARQPLLACAAGSGAGRPAEASEVRERSLSLLSASVSNGPECSRADSKPSKPSSTPPPWSTSHNILPRCDFLQTGDVH